MLFLVFDLGGQRFALDTSTVVEVLPLVEWKKLPGTPVSVLGAFSYHGTLVPVVDPGALAVGSATSARLDTRLAVVDYPVADGDSRLLAILLESATALQRLDDAAFTASPIASNAAYAGGVATTANGMIQRIHLTELVPPDLWDRMSAEQDSAP